MTIVAADRAPGARSDGRTEADSGMRVRSDSLAGEGGFVASRLSMEGRVKFQEPDEAVVGTDTGSVELLEQVRSSLDWACRRLVDLEGRLEARTEENRNAEKELEELSTRLVEAEQAAARTMSLYVATYQLHSTLNPSEVLGSIVEVAVDLLGAASLAILIRREDGETHEVAVREGVEDGGMFSGSAYRGGDPMVDASLADGVIRRGPDLGSSAVVCVPFTAHGTTLGALVVLSLLQHKPSLRTDDRDLLDLLAAHAASAIVAAQAYSRTHRRLQSLEGLVELVRPGLPDAS